MFNHSFALKSYMKEKIYKKTLGLKLQQIGYFLFYSNSVIFCDHAPIPESAVFKMTFACQKSYPDKITICISSINHVMYGPIYGIPKMVSIIITMGDNKRYVRSLPLFIMLYF